ncbi:hypothetical protein BDV98DRAFT_559510 [Pterulicium gracile]|uniref:Uncharacterized protein n=1 Tax=Pterulicium gracile TaxID=1884261 RepID=A0A5C3R5V3_9AGAR|nr:hypothetical protein BDV98DRAFT_559510 [Pterula gracilis]
MDSRGRRKAPVNSRGRVLHEQARSYVMCDVSCSTQRISPSSFCIPASPTGAIGIFQ